ncbi:MAG: Fic family protein [Candidatus Paceibacterota bacterium]
MFLFPKDAENKIEATITSVVNVYFGQDNYPSTKEKAVALLYFFIKNHPFTDGNKRVAITTFSIICERNELAPNTEEFPLDEIAVFILESKQNHTDLIKLLAKVLFE